MNHRSYRTAAAIVGVAALPLLGMAVPAAATPATATVRGNAPSWAKASNLKGHPNSSALVTVRVGLAPRDAAGAAAYAAAVSNPRSSSYRHFLTPSDYQARFGATTAQTDQVAAYLSGAGLKVLGRTASGDAVTARGTVAQVNKAFHVTLGLYQHGSRVVQAPNASAQVPASLASIVLSVGGLTDTAGAVRPNVKNADGTLQPLVVATPCSHYYGENHVSGLPAVDGQTSYPTANCGYTPSQIRGAYSLSPIATRADGAGATVAIIDAYAWPTMASDAQTYAANHGLPAYTAGQYTEYPPSAAYYDQDVCGAAGWAGEEALDIDAVHSMAPGADIAYVPTSSCNDEDFLNAYDRILTPSADASAPLATIVSNSYGDTSDLLPGDLQNQEHAYFVQGAAEGVGFYFSSGDDGDAAADNNGIPQPQASANDPAVTAVGGTTLGVNADNSYQFETGWGNDRTYLVTDKKTKQTSWLSLPGAFYAGAGGGTSAVWSEPDYQKGIVPDALANSLSGDKGPGRVVPDVAAVADPYTGFLEGYSTPDKKGVYHYSEGSIGGTSLACPVFAGLMAVAQQRAGGTPIGFANPLLYGLRASAFHDVSHPATPDQSRLVYYSPSAGVTRLVTQDHDTSLATGPGYDDVTGRGSPAGGFIAAVGAAAAG